MQEAERAALAAEEQTKISPRQLRIDAAQPYVWADIRPDDSTGTLLNLLVGNSGPTVAEKVRIEVTRPLPSIEAQRHSVEAAKAILTEGIESLPPARCFSGLSVRGFNLTNDVNIPQAYKFKITARGPFGQVRALTYLSTSATGARRWIGPPGTFTG